MKTSKNTLVLRAFALAYMIGLLPLLFVSPAAERTGPAPTFTKDVAPVLYQNCVVCHRPGEVAPMSLLTYQDARPWARSIREVVADARMPPWLADPKHGAFANDRRLSQKDAATLMAWVDGGAKQGDPKDLPSPPRYVEGWNIGQPDVVLSMTEDFAVPTDGVIPYKYFVVPTNFAEDRYVQFAEIRPGNRSVVHHVIVSVREPAAGAAPPAGELRVEARGREASRQEGEGADEGSPRGRNADGMLVGLAPGMSPLRLPARHAKLVKKGSMLVLQMHYTTNGEAATDRTSVGLIFAKGPVEKRVITHGASARKLEIPPGEPNYESTSSFEFKEDSRILSFMPHMHVRGKDFVYKLVYPDGTSKILLSVPRYDFNWQLTYFLKEPIAVPKGSRLECTAHHDNSTNNKFNPDPTRLVRWGPQTWEEMMIGWFDYTLDSQNLLLQTAAK